ncbi:hypothetical protein DFH28DRAFT_1016108, partial [Melampsora americana]
MSVYFLRKCTCLSILCVMLLTLFSTFNRADDFIVRCCGRARTCSKTIENPDCGTKSDGTTIPYTCQGIHMPPRCPNNGRIRQTCNHGQPACKLPPDDNCDDDDVRKDDDDKEDDDDDDKEDDDDDD